MTWHAPTATLARYVATPEALDDATAASIEQHLISCADCRATTAAAARPTDLDASWAAIADVIDQPRSSVVERVLRRCGVADDTARIVGATPGLRAAWLGTAALLGWAASFIASENASDAFFLAVAPLVPLGAVLLTFLPADDPGGEAGAATAMHGAGILLRRSLAILLPTFAVLTVIGLFQHDATGAGAHWLLPALALTLTSLVLSTYVRATTATTITAAGWLVLLVAVKAAGASRQVALGSTALFTVSGQLAATALALAAAVILYLRRDRFATMEVSW